MVKMVTAPAYYAINESFNQEIRIKINNDVVRTETTVKSVTLGVEIEQKSNNTIAAGNSMRVDVLKANSKADVRLDNFYLHIKVPTDCARISTFESGTWNASVWYSITYRTNMQEYRTLAANLNSSSHYSYDLSTQALGLMANEYVTDIRMEFGTVPAGFTQTSKTAYLLYVMSTVYDGYKLLARAEIGGQHNTTSVTTNGNVNVDNPGAYVVGSGVGNYMDGAAGGQNNAAIAGTGGAATLGGTSGQWATAASTWTTTVTNKQKLPSSLPKTGY